MYTLQGLAIALALQGVNAFPSVLSERDHVVTSTKCKTSKLCDKKLDIPDSILKGGTSGAVKLSKDRNNCGLLCGPCKDFDAADQLVSTSGKYAYKPPTITQVRGPCPGLNAAANHNYLPRTGVPSITQAIFGLSKLYSMSFDLGGFLAAYAVALDGDIVTQTWSIGGPSPYQEQLSGVLGTPQGISYSHNKYEGDSSIGRCDAYINDGDAHSLSVQRFKYAYETGLDDDRYTLDKFSQAFTKNSERSVKTNKYFFAPLFSTTLVSPAAYNFVINFMSNHTAEEPAGYLNGAMFKEFFAIEGEYPNFKWLPGQERVPNNWYRRPRNNPYTAAKGVFGDLIAEFLAYPNSFKFGGNTGTTDSYVGIDIANFTNGAYNAETLFKGDNFACFLFQEQQQAIPDFLKGKTAAAQLALKALTKLFGQLDCPQTSKFNDNVYGQYPGYSYSPKPGKGVPTTC